MFPLRLRRVVERRHSLGAYRKCTGANISTIGQLEDFVLSRLTLDITRFVLLKTAGADILSHDMNLRGKAYLKTLTYSLLLRPRLYGYLCTTIVVFVSHFRDSPFNVCYAMFMN